MRPTASRQHLFLAEQRKLHTRYVWLVPVGFLALLLLWTLASARNFDDMDRATGYQYFLYSMSLMNSIFMPVMLAVVASRLCDMEIRGNTLKLLYTLERPGRFYDIKYLFEMKYLIVFSAGETLGLILLGKVMGFTERIRPDMFAEHFIAMTAVGAVILSIQHVLSLVSDNQILPLIVGIAGGFLGLFSMFFPAAVNRLVLWGVLRDFLRSGSGLAENDGRGDIPVLSAASGRIFHRISRCGSGDLPYRKMDFFKKGSVRDAASMYQGGKSETETFYYMERLYSYSDYSGGHGNSQLPEQCGTSDGRVVFSLDPVHPVLFLAVLCAFDRAVLFLPVAAGTSEQ